MKKKTCGKNRIISCFITICLCLSAAACVTAALSRPVRADVATDYISIRIGYQSWDLDEYVETGNYFWGDIEGMAYDSFYSYFSGKETNLLEKDGGGIAYYEYNAIVDYAFGVDLKQLLEYAHVYFGDIYNILFWVEDHSTIWCAFDRDALFYGRYYFPDISGNRTVYYDEGERPYAYSFNDMGDQYEVSPMMAIEDAWISFSEASDHSVVDIETAIWERNLANRFRLLFGQTDITSRETDKSAKYVSTIYVTYWGEPVFGEMPELDGTLGSHQVDLQVSTEADMRYALSELMKLSSTDENVLQITGMEILPDEYFSDKTTVRIYYDIVGEGAAGITAGIGRNAAMAEVTQIVDTDDFRQPDDDPKDESSGEGSHDDESGGSSGGSGDDGHGADNTDNGSGNDGTGQGGERGSGQEGTVTPGTDEGSSEEGGAAGLKPEDSQPEPTGAPSPADASDPAETPASQPDTVPEAENAEHQPVPEQEQEIKTPEVTTEMRPEEPVEKAEEKPLETLKPEDSAETAELIENRNSVILMKKLSNSAAGRLEDALADKNMERSPSEMTIYTPQLANREIDQLRVEDNTEEKEREKRLILLCTALTCAALTCAGAGVSFINYRVCLKTERFYSPFYRFSKWLKGE